MADNTTLNPGTGGDIIRAEEKSGSKTQVMLLDIGGVGAESLVDGSNPLPVTVGNFPGTYAVTGTFWQATQPVSGNVGISGSVAVTGTFFQATQPVSAASLPLPTGAASESTLAAVNAKLPALISVNPGPTDPALTVAQRPVDIWAATFAAVGTFDGALNPKFTLRRLGTGVTASQAAGSLAIVAGTTINAEMLARSVDTFSGAFIHRLRIGISQRIVNNNFAVVLADRIGEGLAYNCTSATVVDVTLTAHGYTAINVGQAINLGGLTVTSGTGVPGRYVIASIPDVNTIRFTVAGWATGTGTLDLFGWNYYRALYTGASPTAVAVDAQRQGWASGDTTATINTTAGTGHLLQLAVDGRGAYWSDTLAASSTTPTVTTRASRFENLPEATVPLYLYMWSFNGTVAPASSTTYTVGFVSMEDTVNNPVYLAGVRPTGQAAPLPISGTVAIGAGTASIGTLTRQSGFSDSSTVLAAAATFTGTGRVTTGANFREFAATAFSDQAGTLFIDLSVDTGTTYRAIASVAVAAGVAQQLTAQMTGAAGTATLYRVRYLNGATLQTAFQLTSAFLA